MNDAEPAALLQALTLLTPFAGAHATTVLRKAVTDLVSGPGSPDLGQDAHPADMATPPAMPTDGATCPSNAQSTKSRTSLKVSAIRTVRQAPAKKAAPRRPSPSNDTPETAAWLELRAAVRELHPDNAGLGAAVGLSPSTMAGVMGRRALPAGTVLRRLQTLLSGDGSGKPAPAVPPREAQDGAEHPPAALPHGNGANSASPALPKPAEEVAGNGQRAAEDVRALAAKLWAKRRPLPLTSTTLAGQIGVQPDELDDALHARPVPPQAAERLAAWAAG